MVLLTPRNEYNPITVSDLEFKLDEIKGRNWLEGLSFICWLEGGAYAGHFLIILVNFSKVMTRRRLIISVKHFNSSYEETFHQYSCKTAEVQWDDPFCKTSGTAPDGSFFKWDESKHCYEVLLNFQGQRYRLDFVTECQGHHGGHGFRMGDGKVGYSKDKGLYTFNAFFPRASISGKINNQTVSGHAFIGRNAVNVPLHQVCTSSTHFKLHTPDFTFHFIEMNVKQGGERLSFSYGSFVRDKQLIAVTMDNGCTVERGKKDSFSGYRPPEKMVFAWKGTTIDGKKPFEATAKVEADPPNLPVIDVLSNIPKVLRWIVQKLFAKPYMYQYMKPATVNVKVGGQDFEVVGTALYENHFINPD